MDGPERTYLPGEYGGAPNANCPPGYTVIGTGFNGPFSSVGGFVKKYGTFVGGFFSNTSSIPVVGSVQAICAQVSGTAVTRSSRTDQEAQFRADVAAASALLGQ